MQRQSTPPAGHAAAGPSHAGDHVASPHSENANGSVQEPGTLSDAERVLDEAIELTFPASDPIAVGHAYRSAIQHDRQRRAT
jgi:hypothetical protein